MSSRKKSTRSFDQWVEIHTYSSSESGSSSDSEGHSSSGSYQSASSSSAEPRGEVTYQYDALTRRTRKTNGAGAIDYYYDKQWRAIEEWTGGSVDAHYVWSPLDRWTMIRRKRGGEELYVLKDYLDPAAIIDTGGNVVERFGYDAFGPARFMAPDFSPRPSSAADWNFLFHAEFLDEDTGLYNYGYRYYNPELGRWISRDPIGERGGLNLYGFLHNDAIWTFDYLGLSKNWFQESSFDCEIVFFFGHARNPSLTQGERTSINTVAIAVYQYNTEADSRKTGKLRRALALGMCCNAWIPKDKETQETKTINPSTAPKITSNIGVKDDVEHYWNNMKKADQPETPHGLVDPTSPSANNQISGTSQNAIPSDFDPEYFGKLDQQQKWNAQQSIGAVRVAMQMWKHYEAGACNCGCDEVLMRIVFVGENAKGKFTQRQNYVSHLTAEARARMGLADFPWGENFQKTIPCKK